MLTESTNNLTYEKLSPEEMKSRGILGRLVGVCADFMSPTRNGRKYPEQLWENIFNSEIMKERISNGVCFGELGHPADREETDMEKICICMPEEPKKGPDGKLRAVFDILDTPNGRILKSLCDYGSTLGISSRGSGDLETDFTGQESVNPDTYNCEGFDIVLLPGVKDARLQYVTESLDVTKENKTLRQQLKESINNESVENQKVMKESLDTLGINLEEGAYTKDELIDKFGTDDLDIINAGNEETVTLKEFDDSEYHMLDKSYEHKKEFYDRNKQSGNIADATEYLDSHDYGYEIYFDKTDDGCTLFYNGELGVLESWDDLKKLLHENVALQEAKLTPQEKMDAWASGERRENIRACSDSKLEMYRDICEKSGYDAQVKIIDKELESRGLSDKKEKLVAKMIDDGQRLLILDNETGRDFLYSVLGKTSTGHIIQADDDNAYHVIERDDPRAEKIADALLSRLNESLQTSQNEEDNIDEVQADDNDMAIANELQEALKLNKKLDEKIINLQEKLSACYAKEMELEEAIDNYKNKIAKLSNKSKENKALTEKLSKLEIDLKNSKNETNDKKSMLHETMQRDAKERKSLQESIERKDNEIKELNEKLKKVSNENSQLTNNVNDLNEKLATAHKDNRQIKEKYSVKLDNNNKLIEKYKKIARSAVDKYINKQATILGVSSNEIKNRLPESYSFTDIDNVCESLREYKVNINSLPFNTTKLNENINLTVKNINNNTLVRNIDDEISDADLKLAERFIK